jgi:hypothetical protein
MENFGGGGGWNMWHVGVGYLRRRIESRTLTRGLRWGGGGVNKIPHHLQFIRTGWSLALNYIHPVDSKLKMMKTSGKIDCSTCPELQRPTVLWPYGPVCYAHGAPPVWPCRLGYSRLLREEHESSQSQNLLKFTRRHVCTVYWSVGP